MQNLLIAGAGKIGSLVATMLAESGDYQVFVTDVSFEQSELTEIISSGINNIETHELDISDKSAVVDFIKTKEVNAIISCLPYFLNKDVAEIAKETSVHYFDLTEDTSVTAHVKALAEGADTAFVPQCGLAPGFVSVVANSLMKRFDEIETVKLRVGALPQHSSNSLSYALTWSTDGLINQYGNPCHGVENFENVLLKPLAGLESIQIDGWSYEAFNTSGGLGSLAELWQGKVKNMTYKTLRYPGHCEKMRVLMEELKLNSDRETLKRILENAIPKTEKDVVIVYVSVTGTRDGVYLEDDYLKKVYPSTIAGREWSAIQTTTAAGCCATLDTLLNSTNPQTGFVYQENFSMQAFLANRFAKCYK